MFNAIKSLFSGVNVPTVDPVTLHAQLQEKKPPLVVDVRSKGEIKEGHIAKAKFIPLSNFSNALNKLPKNRAIVCVCHSGWRSNAACKQLIQAGFTDVTNMSGGMFAWSRADLPTKK
ncbi:rhodanese-like domain-containing protein [Anaerolineales bacterium HSG6]|nr:rhodanese-like domain-containing protein [Anaerolineales bacterium HSG6]MDM8530848.1 rhodanese-like domain-containing protein [Anaerolineales bacterium HSG25]